jgi:hypothetical protein
MLCSMAPNRDRLVRRFSQANALGPGREDVPALLRRVADSIEELGTVDVVGIVMQVEVDADGDWPSMDVYYIDENEDTVRPLRAVTGE